MMEQKWTRLSLPEICRQLKALGYRVSRPTVSRLLKQQHYTLKANLKNAPAKAHPDRDEQFRYIAAYKQAFCAIGEPVISIDAKKTELIGNFKNDGQAWCQEAEVVEVHDFPTTAVGRAIPYGIYDLLHNRGDVYVGTSANTPQFAADALARWWRDAGQVRFPGATHLLILADSGGSNAAASRVWKQQIQRQFCDQFGLVVTICHYPTGCSKWNPIEHKLFCYISKNWAGKPLRSFAILLAYLRGTTTRAGLTINASVLEGHYPTGQKVSDEEMRTLNLERHVICPKWNYTIRPRQGSITAKGHPS